MDNLKETRWFVVKALLDEFPDIRSRVKEYLREEWEKRVTQKFWGSPYHFSFFDFFINPSSKFALSQKSYLGTLIKTVKSDFTWELAENTPSSEVHVLHQLGWFPIPKRFFDFKRSLFLGSKMPSYIVYVKNWFLDLFFFLDGYFWRVFKIVEDLPI